MQDDITRLQRFAVRFHYPRFLFTGDGEHEIRHGELHWQRFLLHACAEDITQAMGRVKRAEARFGSEEAS